jgi:hypothetical protein
MAVGAWSFAVALFFVDHSGGIYDDAYIYFRYVDNLRDGCGFRFNCGDDSVEGFSSPLYLGMLWLGSFLTSDLEAIAQLLGAAGLAGTGVAITSVALARGISVPGELINVIATLGAVTLALAGDHFVLVNTTIGLETGVSICAVTLCGASVLTERRQWLRTLLVVAVLCRPEAAVLVVALPLLPFARKFSYLLPLAAGLTAVVAWRWFVFGDVAPNTFWAKAGGTSGHARLGVEYIWMVISYFPWILAAPLALLRQDLRRETGYLVAASVLWFLFFLRSGGDMMPYGRLAAPLVPILTLLGVIGLIEATRRAFAGLRIETGRRREGLIAVAAAALIHIFVARAHHLAPGHGFANVQRWTLVGEYLAREHPGATIATVPIGAIGYFSALPTIDMVGLTDRHIAKSGNQLPPELLRRAWLGHERHDLAYLLERGPDLVVTGKWRSKPWTIAEARAGFYATWLVLESVKAGTIPYGVFNAEIQPGVYWLMFARESAARRPFPPGRLVGISGQ